MQIGKTVEHIVSNNVRTRIWNTVLVSLNNNISINIQESIHLYFIRSGINPIKNSFWGSVIFLTTISVNKKII